MKQEVIINILKTLKPELKTRYKVDGMALFGSLVRNEATTKSDIDVLVDFNDSATLFDLSGLGLFLEEHFNCPVDIVSRCALRKELRASVLQECIEI
ncbi:nucleotidyltransferase family protein [candidate division KSB1 bacterium]|nr:nucleotidyltransferase family protein [candidate division KSB1 bacterium]